MESQQDSVMWYSAFCCFFFFILLAIVWFVNVLV